GLVTVFANNSRARAEIERFNQQTDNGRYAVRLLADDLHHAGYLAELNPIGLPLAAAVTAKPDPCATDAVSLTNDALIPIQGYDVNNGVAAPTCVSAPTVTDLKPGTDILVVRRASSCVAGAAGCDPVVAGAAYANLTLQKAVVGACAASAPLRQYRTHIYFIALNDKPGDGIPTLKRAELGAVGAGAVGFNIVPLVEGIENLQIEYGLDTSVPTTGAPAVYSADPDHYSACAPLTCVSYWQNTVAAKLYVLARSTTQTPGYVDGKQYTLGLTAAGAANTVGPYNDGFKRHLYQSVVTLNNGAGRNTP
ncbi:MAG: hypothetical protein E6K52_11840, partial [Gammaproteobacteria bacterium]